jgi:Fe-S-cluster-containing dehydrogenase component
MMENEVPEGYTRAWVTEIVRGEFPDLTTEIRSERCNHCEDAPCVAVCPTGASYIDEETGTVQVDANKCTGCKACITACPYDARFVHPDGYVSKCTFCDHRLAKGETSACASTCPTSAIVLGDLDDPDSEVNEAMRGREAKTLKPEAGTKPKIFYLS